MITEQFPITTLVDLSRDWGCGTSAHTFWYLASPYARYCEGKEQAYKVACQYAHDLIRSGVPVFSPIAHSHSIATVCEMDKDSHDLWMPQDLAILRGANGVLIAPMAGWRFSKGVAMEIDMARELGKPIYILDCHW